MVRVLDDHNNKTLTSPILLGVSEAEVKAQLLEEDNDHSEGDLPMATNVTATTLLIAMGEMEVQQ